MHVHPSPIRRLRSRIPAVLLTLVGGVLFSACTVTTPRPATLTPVAGRPADLAADPVSTRMSDREALLRAEAVRWAGTPHRLGGTDGRGIDCSALVQTIYSHSFRTAVPRTTEHQVRIGTPVSPNALEPGDLVFFKPDRRTRHVGIYLSDGEFLHASKSQGVSISNIAEPYWQQRYWTTRRVLPEATPDTRAEAEPPSSPETPKNRRNGW
ncbi:MAG: NlpC/P60 family protein [Rhodothermales bacterium]